MDICVCVCLRLSQACADVRAGPVFWQQLEIVDKLTGNPTLPEWLSTHPSHRNRSSQMDRLIPQVACYTTNRIIDKQSVSSCDCLQTLTKVGGFFFMLLFWSKRVASGSV